MDSIDINRRMLQVNGTLNLYPWKFESGGMVAVSKTSRLRSFGFKIQLVFAALYAVYIDLTLVLTMMGGLRNVRYHIFGMHLMRSLLSTTFSYWAYKLFVANATDHELLYNFTQQSPGKFPASEINF